MSSNDPAQTVAGYTTSARWQDLVYSDKPYIEEAWQIRELIRRHFGRGQSGAFEDIAVLDVGCGTAIHLAWLARSGFRLAGLDNSECQLAVARARLKQVKEDDPAFTADVPLHHGDLKDFSIGQKFQVIMSLFGAFPSGCLSVEELNQGCMNVARHLSPGGLFIVEASRYTGKEVARPRFGQEDSKAVARFGRNRLDGRMLTVEHVYVADPGPGLDVEVIHEVMQFALFTDAEYLGALRSAGLTAAGPTRLHPFKSNLFIATK